MDKWLLGLVLGFVLRQIAKFSTNTDWNKVKADADLRVAALVPGVMFDQAACDLVNSVIDCFSSALKDTADLQAIADSVLKLDWAGALAAIEALILKITHPAQAQALATVRAMKSAL